MVLFWVWVWDQSWFALPAWCDTVILMWFDDEAIDVCGRTNAQEVVGFT